MWSAILRAVTRWWSVLLTRVNGFWSTFHVELNFYMQEHYYVRCVHDYCALYIEKVFLTVIDDSVVNITDITNANMQHEVG